jgi:hypothetical protein
MIKVILKLAQLMKILVRQLNVYQWPNYAQEGLLDYFQSLKYKLMKKFNILITGNYFSEFFNEWESIELALITRI